MKIRLRNQQKNKNSVNSKYRISSGTLSGDIFLGDYYG